MQTCRKVNASGVRSRETGGIPIFTAFSIAGDVFRAGIAYDRIAGDMDFGKSVLR